MKNAPRKISLRFLREGPPHNHLLSPLTPYLAVIGRNEAVSLKFPYEHRRLLRDLTALRYGATSTSGPELAKITAPDRRMIADTVSEIFEAIPGLTAELGTRTNCHPELVQMELVFSAAELSMLPFELATSPRGFPGEGLPLSVQVTTPIVITRTVPSATGRNCRWGVKPRILFAWASPPGMAPVPHQAHLTALVKALEPWTGPLAKLPVSKSEHAQELAKYLKVLPQVTRVQLEECCQTDQFTHVHILAHGASQAELTDAHYALALHHNKEGVEMINAERLQAALRLPLGRPEGNKTLSHPLVVTLATCDSGNQAQVVTPGMSLVHAIHAAGVPLVVGSLFPLSFRGSVVLTERLYSGLLKGDDPRWVLYKTRHALFRMDEQGHDWASMVAYASLPEDVAAQAMDVAYLAACKTIDAHVKIATKLVEQLKLSEFSKELLTKIQEHSQSIQDAEKRLPDQQTYWVEGNGMRASAEKKRAQILFNAGFLDQSVEALHCARKIYLNTSRVPPWAIQRPVLESTALPTMHWVLTQALGLEFVLKREINQTQWNTALGNASLFLSEFSSPENTKQTAGDVIWAYGTLVELYLLAHGMQKLRPEEWTGNFEKLAEDALNNFLIRANNSGESFFSESTHAQLKRYTEWWLTPAFTQACGHQATDPAADAVIALAEKLINRLKKG